MDIERAGTPVYIMYVYYHIPHTHTYIPYIHIHAYLENLQHLQVEIFDVLKMLISVGNCFLQKKFNNSLLKGYVLSFVLYFRYRAVVLNIFRFCWENWHCKNYFCMKREICIRNSLWSLLFEQTVIVSPTASNLFNAYLIIRNFPCDIQIHVSKLLERVSVI